MSRISIEVSNEPDEINESDIKNALQSSGLDVTSVSVEGKSKEDDESSEVDEDKIEDIDGLTGKGNLTKDVDVT